MIKLFKLKSLKKTQETEQGAGICASVQGAKNKNAKKQRGRSMVEMLGVLAIIGVLSIGGIQGYTMAMRKYRANEILNVVQKYAMVLYSSCQQEMINNPAVYNKWGILVSGAGIDDRSFWQCSGIKFTDAGLGAMPSGATSIGYLSSNDNPMVTGGHFNETYAGVTIKSLSSGDAVVITVQFETKELCETVMGITGKPTVSSEGTLGMFDTGNSLNNNVCGNQENSDFPAGYYLAVTTMMN